MTYDFNTPIDRHGTGSVKWDGSAEMGHAPDELPLWVADMDFASPPEVLDALRDRVDHGVFGYTMPTEAYLGAVTGWISAHFGWTPEPEEVVTTPGVVFALAQAVRAYTKPGDAVIIQRPVYYPFSNVIRQNGRKLVNAPLVYRRDEGRYTIDLVAFEEAVEGSGAKLFILCNPHNPVGRCWTREELEGLGNVCLSHGVTVVSDEIHADIVRAGHHHTAFAAISPAFAQASVTCTAASKTFNLAGLQTSNIVIPNEDLRARFKAELSASGASGCNLLGLTATQAAYTHGEEWLAQFKARLADNLGLVRDRLAEVPELRLVEPEATYLVWIDCQDLGLDEAGLTRFVERDAKLWLDMGNMFGPEGEGFVRVNIASPRPLIEQAMDQLTRAVRAR